MIKNYCEQTYKCKEFSIYSREWRTEKSKATIIILHGYSEYSGRYDIIGNYFFEKGYNVFMPDLPGHGRSSGMKGRPRTYIDKIKTYCDTIDEYITIIKEDMKQRNISSQPFFFYGHSMGGLITSILAGYHTDITGFILSSPGLILNLPFVYTFWYFWFILLFFLPNLVLASPVKTCSNTEKINDCANDPFMFHGKACAKTSFEIAKSGFLEKDKDLTVPVLLLHGDADVLVDVKGSRIKSTHLLHPSSKYIEYPGANHVLLEEPNHMEIIKTIEQWMNQFF